jgi:hypothetical protein
MQKIDKNQECHGNQRIQKKIKIMNKFKKIKMIYKKRNKNR